MQPAFFSGVRTNISHLPRSVSPHLASPTSPASASSSIRSLSPSRHSSSPQLRSRSSSPTPRRFASVLAYHPSPPPDSNHSHHKRQVASSENLPRSLGREQEPNEPRDQLCRKESHDRDESPSRIAVRNLEESWKRFELEASASSSPLSSPSLVSTQGTFGSSSPSPLSKPPYRELIECTSVKEISAVQGTQSQEGNINKNTQEDIDASGESRSDPLSSSTAHIGHSGGLQIDRADPVIDADADADRNTNTNTNMDTNTDSDKDTAQSAGTGHLESRASRAEQSLPDSSSSQSTTSSSISLATVAAAHEHHHQASQDQRSSFLASSEARLILDLPSLLGKDPDMISDVLAMPVPLQSSKPPRSSSTTSPMLSNLDAKAESTAKAMTKRYAAKNLNMTETEAHRMVQVMAAEIVALHEEREVMLQKMQLAKEEMLEAARLLRMKADLAMGEREQEVATADASSGEAEEMQDMSASMSRSIEKAGDDSDEDEQSKTSRHYDRDEWRDTE